MSEGHAEAERTEDELKKHFQSQLSSHIDKIQNIEISLARRKNWSFRAATAKVAYVDAFNQTRKLTYTGKLFMTEAHFKADVKSLQTLKLAAPDLGPSSITITDMMAIFLAFPNDMDLPGTVSLATPEALIEDVKTNPGMVGITEKNISVTSLKANRLKYLGRRYCSYGYDMTYQTDGGATENRHRFCGRAYRGKKGVKAYKILNRISENDACRKHDFLIPQFYSYDGSKQILWQQMLITAPLSKQISTIKNLPQVAFAVGKGLAAFHRLGLPLKEKMTFPYVMNNLQRRASIINRAFPEMQSGFKLLLDQLIDEAHTFRDRGQTTIHGNFKLSHIFDTEEGPLFNGLSSANLGDPGYDVGQFISHLLKMYSVQKLSEQRVRKAKDAFCEGYNTHATTPLSQRVMDWFSLYHLISSQASKAIKRRDEKKAKRILNLIQEFYGRSDISA